MVLAIPKIKNTLLPGITRFPTREFTLPKNTRTVGSSVGGSKMDKTKAAEIKMAGSLRLAIPAIIHINFRNFLSLLGKFFQPCCTSCTIPVLSSRLGCHCVSVLHNGHVGVSVVCSQLTKQYL